MGLFGTKEEKETKKNKKNEDLHRKGEKLFLEAQALENKGKIDKAKKTYKKAAIASPNVAFKYVERLKNEDKWEEYFDICYECHYNVVQRDDIEYLPFYKMAAECCFEGKGTPLNRPKAYTLMKQYGRLSDTKDDLSIIMFMLKCARGIMADFKNKECPDIAHLRKNDMVGTTNELKWNLIKRDLEIKAADLGVMSAIIEVSKSDDVDLAYKNTVRLARSGDYDAAANLFWRFLKMYEPPKDFDVTNLVVSIENGAKNNHPDCMFALSLLYLKGFVNTCIMICPNKEQWKFPMLYSQEKFVYWLKKANDARVDRIMARVMLAEYYTTGKIWKDYNFDQEPGWEMKVKEICPEKAYEILNRSTSPDPTIIFSWKDGGPWEYAGRRLLLAMLFYGYGTETDVDRAQDLIGTYGSDHSIHVTEIDSIILDALKEEFEKAVILQDELKTNNKQ